MLHETCHIQDKVNTEEVGDWLLSMLTSSLWDEWAGANQVTVTLKVTVTSGRDIIPNTGGSARLAIVHADIVPVG